MALTRAPKPRGAVCSNSLDLAGRLTAAPALQTSLLATCLSTPQFKKPSHVSVCVCKTHTNCVDKTSLFTQESAQKNATGTRTTPSVRQHMLRKDPSASAANSEIASRRAQMGEVRGNGSPSSIPVFTGTISNQKPHSGPQAQSEHCRLQPHGGRRAQPRSAREAGQSSPGDTRNPRGRHSEGAPSSVHLTKMSVNRIRA